MRPRDAAATVRTVSALRALCLALPHVPTPAEAQRLQRFEMLVISPESAGSDDVEAVLAGWREWWRRGRTGEVVAMARRLPAALARQDRRLAPYLLAAGEASRTSPDRRIDHGHRR